MKQDKHLFDNRKNVKRVIYFLYVICALLLGLDFVVSRHASHPLDAIYGFYPLYGFIGCVVLVIIAKWLRAIIAREEDYYSDNKSESARKKLQQHENRQSHVDN